jgi:carbonic anhydrase/acetyltransferase-like protein (isoleucine patch superfamily)
MKKYEMTSNVKEFLGHKLFQIKALKDFGDVKAGDLGGYIEKEENLSHDGIAWVYRGAQVFGNAKIICDAQIFDNAQVYGDACICGDAWVFGEARVYDNARVSDHVEVCGKAQVYGNAQICGDAQIYDNASVSGNARVFGDAQVLGNARVCGNAQIYNDALICDSADYICFQGFGSKSRNTTIFRTRNENIMVKCGCFTGNLKEFSEKIKETHGNTKYAKEYLACIEVAKIHFGTDE